MNIPMIISNGNHDGKERLNYGASWFEHSKLFIRTKLKHMNQPIEFNDVHFYVLPFATISEVKEFLKMLLFKLINKQQKNVLII